jgi:hypothetical protein
LIAGKKPKEITMSATIEQLQKELKGCKVNFIQRTTPLQRNFRTNVTKLLKAVKTAK